MAERFGNFFYSMSPLANRDPKKKVQINALCINSEMKFPKTLKEKRKKPKQNPQLLLFGKSKFFNLGHTKIKSFLVLFFYL